MRRLLAVALALLVAVPAWAGSNLQRLSGPAPFWVLRGQGVPATLDYDFAGGRYYQAGLSPGNAFGQLTTTSRASAKYCDNTAGTWGSVGNNVLCVTNKGAPGPIATKLLAAYRALIASKK